MRAVATLSFPIALVACAGAPPDPVVPATAIEAGPASPSPEPVVAEEQEEKTGGSSKGLIGVGGEPSRPDSYPQPYPRFSSAAAAHPPIEVGEFEIEGPLERKVVERIVRAHINSFRGCYANGLAEDPTLAGVVRLRLEVGPQGHVLAAEGVNAEAVVGPEVARCMVEASKTMRFPFPAGGGDVVITCAFELEPPPKQDASSPTN